MGGSAVVGNASGNSAAGGGAATTGAGGGDAGGCAPATGGDAAGGAATGGCSSGGGGAEKMPASLCPRGKRGGGGGGPDGFTERRGGGGGIDVARRSEGGSGRAEGEGVAAAGSWLSGGLFAAGGSFEDIRRTAYLSSRCGPKSVNPVGDIYLQGCRQHPGGCKRLGVLGVNLHVADGPVAIAGGSLRADEPNVARASGRERDGIGGH